MLLLRQPNRVQIEAFLAAQSGQCFSYEPIGGTQSGRTPGYFSDHASQLLGHGECVFLAAREAICRWEMFSTGWTHLCWPTAPIHVGQVVAVIAGRFRIWTMNACRIVYTIDEIGETSRFGFAYGTLPDHIERGEERFLIEWRRADNSVHYHIDAFSWPNHWVARCGLPLMRLLQRQFRRDSIRAMQRAVAVGPRLMQPYNRG